jgi:glycosyltransferase involved in cell wall biosynthesis
LKKISRSFLPLVSIIMNCRNGEKYLKKSLKSVISQTYSNWELIFFDNCSKDRSKKILKEFKDKRIKYFKSKKILKLYEARNAAISKSKGKFITFLDTDDWWINSKLSKQIKIMLRNKKINIIYSNLYIFNQKKNFSFLYFNKIMPSGKITQFLLNDYKIAILTIMLKKKIFKDNHFNKNYNIIGDLDFFINLSLREKFYCMQEPLAYYRQHNENFSKKIDIFTKELDHWSKKNFKKFTKLNFSLKRFKYFYYKIKFKKIIGWKL